MPLPINNENATVRKSVCFFLILNALGSDVYLDFIFQVFGRICMFAEIKLN